MMGLEDWSVALAEEGRLHEEFANQGLHPVDTVREPAFSKEDLTRPSGAFLRAG